jgi:hypothetical protein
VTSTGNPKKARHVDAPPVGQLLIAELYSAVGLGIGVRVASPAKQCIRQPFPSEDEAVDDAQVEEGDNNVCVPPAGVRQWQQPLSFFLASPHRRDTPPMQASLRVA